MNQNLIPFYGQIIFHYIDIPQLQIKLLELSFNSKMHNIPLLGTFYLLISFHSNQPAILLIQYVNGVLA